MTAPNERFDRALPDLFVELAAARTPDYLEAAIERASSLPQRPAWTYIGRWLPVQVTTQAVPPATRLPLRQLGVLALVAILLAMAAVAYVGSRKAPSPAPLFGLAGNGHVALERAGDIYAVDHATGAATALVTGPERDQGAVFSRDGTKVAFVRSVGDKRLIMVANADGSGLAQVTPEPLAGLQWWTLSPDGRHLLVATSFGGVSKATLLAVDGASKPITIDVPLSANPDMVEPMGFRPPDGREILLTGQPAGATTRGLYVADAATGKLLRTIVEPSPSFDLAGPSWSSTGESIGYHRFPVQGDGINARFRVVAADGTGDRLLDPNKGSGYDALSSDWSNDGTRIVLVSSTTTDGSAEQMRVVSLRGDAAPVDLDCRLGDCADAWFWSPDDTMLLGVRQGGKYVVADPRTGVVTPKDWVGTGDPAWQRLAK